MFNHDYFAASFFAPSYFPPVTGVGPVIPDALMPGGARPRKPDVTPEAFDTDDAVLMMLF